jgi:hypothetical protein
MVVGVVEVLTVVVVLWLLAVAVLVEEVPVDLQHSLRLKMEPLEPMA